MTPLHQYLSDLEALHGKTTKGPWESKLNHHPYKCVHISEDEMYSTLELLPEDADFIATSHSAIPRLIAMLREAVAGLEEMQGYLDVPRGLHAAYAMKDIAGMKLSKIERLQTIAKQP